MQRQLVDRQRQRDRGAAGGEQAVEEIGHEQRQRRLHQRNGEIERHAELVVEGPAEADDHQHLPGQADGEAELLDQIVAVEAPEQGEGAAAAGERRG